MGSGGKRPGAGRPPGKASKVHRVDQGQMHRFLPSAQAPAAAAAPQAQVASSGIDASAPAGQRAQPGVAHDVGGSGHEPASEPTDPAAIAALVGPVDLNKAAAEAMDLLISGINGICLEQRTEFERHTRALTAELLDAKTKAVLAIAKTRDAALEKLSAAQSSQQECAAGFEWIAQLPHTGHYVCLWCISHYHAISVRGRWRQQMPWLAHNRGVDPRRSDLETLVKEHANTNVHEYASAAEASRRDGALGFMLSAQSAREAGSTRPPQLSFALSSTSSFTSAPSWSTSTSCSSRLRTARI